MPTIVTVHGTFASGETAGSGWWQQGSRCEAALRMLLAGPSGELTYLPFAWSGENSEVARRAAARRLLETFEKLEAEGEPYIAIGHSHGGSVIAFALQLAAMRELDLPGLKRWITVGTPFVAFRKKRWLYARGDVFVKGVYVMAVLVVLAVAARLLRLGGPPKDALEAIFFTAATLAALLGVTYLIARFAEGDSPDWKMLKPRFQRDAEAIFSERWMAYWHPADEAVLGLRHAHAMQSRLFPPDFAQPFYLAVLIPGLPLVAFLMALTGLDQHVAAVLRLTARTTGEIGWGIGHLADWYATEAELGAAHLLDRTLMTVLAVPVLAARAHRWLGQDNIVMFAAMLVAAAVAYVWVSRGVAYVLSVPTSWALNALTLAQVRTLVDGADIAGERAVGADVRPSWLAAGFEPLPPDVSAEIAVIADRAATASVAKFRAALGELALSDKLDDLRARFSEYLTWEELVHTAYFNSPKFIYLLAETCAAAEGFTMRPVPAPRSA